MQLVAKAWCCFKTPNKKINLNVWRCSLGKRFSMADVSRSKQAKQNRMSDPAMQYSVTTTQTSYLRKPTYLQLVTHALSTASAVGNNRERDWWLCDDRTAVRIIGNAPVKRALSANRRSAWKELMKRSILLFHELWWIANWDSIFPGFSANVNLFVDRKMKNTKNSRFMDHFLFSNQRHLKKLGQPKWIWQQLPN